VNNNKFIDYRFIAGNCNLLNYYSQIIIIGKTGFLIVVFAALIVSEFVSKLVIKIYIFEKSNNELLALV